MKGLYSIFSRLVPVLMGFFIMGFCDVVGVSTAFLKEHFQLSEHVAGFIPSFVFFWFFILSIPAVRIINQVGLRNLVLISNFISLTGLFIPVLFQSTLLTYILAFVLLGIGNTLLHVSLKPFMLGVYKGDELNEFLLKGNILKIASSFLGPIVAAFSAIQLGNWMYLFPIFGILTIVHSVFLLQSDLEVNEIKKPYLSLTSLFDLLRDKTVLLTFFVLVFLTGADVGMNVVAPKLLTECSGLDAASAGIGASVYFICRLVGVLVGGVLLNVFNELKFLRIHVIVAMLALVLLMFVSVEWFMLLLVGLTGYSFSMFYQILYSKAMDEHTERARELSVLATTGLIGGAVVPILMGYAAEWAGNQKGSLIVILVCLFFPAYFAFKIRHLSK